MTLLVAGLALVLLLIVYEIRTIIRSDYPAIRAIEALAMITPLFLLLFSVAYYLMEHAVPASFGQHLTRTEALYFTITTFSTVGYGDIVPMTDPARVVVMIQILSESGSRGLCYQSVFQGDRDGSEPRSST